MLCKKTIVFIPAHPTKYQLEKCQLKEYIKKKKLSGRKCQQGQMSTQTKMSNRTICQLQQNENVKYNYLSTSAKYQLEENPTKTNANSSKMLTERKSN